MPAVLFDLDGTLTDPAPGISGCIVYALERLGVTAPVEGLNWCIGPPLRGSFSRLLGTEDVAVLARAMELYRERFSAVGLYENSVYDGIPECLGELRSRGVDLFVATSKPHVYANRILEHFGLSEFFGGVYGSELDGVRSDKGELIAHLLSCEGLASSGVVMIGDRSHDVVGAGRCGVPCVGVLYGYGSAEELGEAVAVCELPSQVAGVVLGVLEEIKRGSEEVRKRGGIWG